MTIRLEVLSAQPRGTSWESAVPLVLAKGTR
jgi:hypothetical protein